MRTLIFIHGWASGPYVWFYQIDFFKQRFHIWTPELAGYDSKALNSGGNLFELMVEDVCNLISSNDLDEIHLVGWSLGGMVSLGVASRLKYNINRLILIGSTPRFVQSEDFNWGMSEQRIIRMQERLGRNFIGTLNWFYRSMFIPQERTKKGFGDILNLLGDIIPPLQKVSVVSTLKVLIELDLRYMLKDITAPTLIIHGEKDSICLPEAARFLQTNIKGSRLEFIKLSGHAPFLTNPQKVNNLIEEFIG